MKYCPLLVELLVLFVGVKHVDHPELLFLQLETDWRIDPGFVGITALISFMSFDSLELISIS